ncbi:MAG: VgrG-related protein [Anaerolineales bacterium]|nr:VgrG-related protein [Anaerolineales bacterium]
MSEFIDQFAIKLNGADAPSEMMDALQKVVVETDVHLPAMCTIRLLDEELRWIDSDQLAVGTELIIEAQAQGETSSEKIFDGEITALEPELNPATPILQIRAYDRGHRLHRGRRQSTFVNSTDSDIAQQVAGNAGLQTDAGSTSEVFDHVWQNNQTDWELLQERAHRIGYSCYVEESKLCFKEREPQGEVALEWGMTLTRFRPRLSTSGQVEKVVVKGWDPSKKESISEEVTNGRRQPEIGESRPGGQVAQSAFGSAGEMVIVDRPIHSVNEAKSMAQSIADELSGNFVRADGEALGNPNIKAGCNVNVSAVGDRFSGKYYVTRATHTYTPGGRYTVNFNVTGQRSLSVGPLLSGQKSLRDSSVPGVAVGIVTNNNDADKLGRIKVKYPWMNEQTESFWARLASPGAGKDRGFYYLPEVNDEVLLAFEHNDINYPYIIGYLWNGQDKPPEGTTEILGSDGKVNQRVLRSRTGHLFILDDTDSKQGITIKTQAGHIIFIDDSSGKEAISIIDKTGNNKIIIETNPNKITIMADQDIDIKATKGKILIEAQQGIEVKTPQTVDIKGDMNVNVKGSMGVKVESSANIDIKASAITNVKGSMVNIN